jgi:hypothetical protein
LKIPQALKFLKSNEKLLKVTLMEADLEFEYPQKLAKLQMKANILQEIEEEENKIQQILTEKKIHSEEAVFLIFISLYSLFSTTNKLLNMNHILIFFLKVCPYF